MPTREQVLELLGRGHNYETAARELGVPAGLTYMIATGTAADGSDTVSAAQLGGKGFLEGSSQHLVNPPPFNPTRKEHVIAWVRDRAGRELRRP